MALFAVHTAMRAGEIGNVRWSWEAQVDGHTVLIVPADAAQNGQLRIVVCNRAAHSWVETVAI